MRRYLVFAVVAIPTFLSHVGSTSVSIAFPTMVSYFGTSLVLAGWVVSVYALATIFILPIVAWLSDTVGRRSSFLLCLAFFTSGSLLCAMAPNMGWLIFFRVIQGVGGGGFVASAVGIVSDELPDKRQQFIGLLSSTAYFGMVVGPNIAGVIVQYLGWRSIFWLNVPVGIAAIALCRHFVKADVKRDRHTELDLLGVGLLTGFASAIMVSLTMMGKDYHIPRVVIAVIVLMGFLMLAIFVYRSKRPGALVSRQMLTSRPFLAANAFNFVFGSTTQSGVMTFLPLYATSVYGMSVIESGLVITPRSAGMVVSSVIASFYLVRWGYRRPMLAGSLTVILGLMLMALEPRAMNLFGISIAPVVLVLLICLVLGVGSGLTNPACNNACIELMPDKAASITGLRQISRQTGGAIGIAVSTLVLESSSSITRGFTLLLLGFSAVQLLSLILVFYMPASPVAKPCRAQPIPAPGRSPPGLSG